MIVAPAVDLRGGRCVQLVGGRPEEERVSLPDPLDVAEGWWEAGFATLHVVDLDAALGDGDNHALVRELAASTAAAVQVGGGLRTDDTVAAILNAGAARAIVGTRAVEDRAWLDTLAARHRDRIVVAADVRDGRVLRKGWTEASELEVTDFVGGLAALPLAGVLCTDVGREGRMQGIDGDAMREVIDASQHPVWISGGIATMADLETLDAAGAMGAVAGMGLYTGALPEAEVARRYGGGVRIRASGVAGRRSEDRTESKTTGDGS